MALNLTLSNIQHGAEDDNDYETSESRNAPSWAGEMIQGLETLDVLPEVLSSIPSNYMVAHNHLKWDLIPSSGMSEDITTKLTN